MNEIDIDGGLEVEYTESYGYIWEEQSNIQDNKVLSQKYKVLNNSLEIYPTEMEEKTFNIKYILKNACTRFKDCGELYFYPTGTRYSLKNTQININLPENNKNLKCWNHHQIKKVWDYREGDYVEVKFNGDFETELIGNSKIKIRIKGNDINGLTDGDFRILFDRECIPNSIDEINKNAYDKICNYEGEITTNNIKNVIKISIVLFLYWLILLIIFEFDKKIYIKNIN